MIIQKLITTTLRGALLLATLPLLGYEVTSSVKKIDEHKLNISLTFTLKPGEYLYKDSLTVSANSPLLKITEVKPSTQAVPFFDETYKMQKEGYKGTVTFSVSAQLKETEKEITPTPALLHTHFLISSSKDPQEKTFPFMFGSAVQVAKAPNSAEQEPIPAPRAAPALQASCEVQQPSLIGSFVQKSISTIRSGINHAKSVLTSLFTSTGSLFLRLLAALLLGILLSLTPCIYPMIPITIGILQASGSSSRFKNFLLALSYTMGISTTFALLGFVAALGSCVFGELQGSPFLIIPLAAILIYFALTMFDFVQMYVPSWLQPKTSKVQGGSYLSAFAFGALSGTVASPCLSPGLVLILNYVSHISSNYIAGYLEGFALLFIFGIGSSLPLLIIGTFSGSLRMLPKAGQWMVEIKKIVGIMLISMAFYHLSHLERLLPWYLFAWVVVASFFALGVYYFVTIHAHDTKAMRRYKNFMGVLMIVLGCIIGIQGQKAVYDHLYPSTQESLWLHDYQEALARAQKESKPLFIDIGATHCSMCSALDKRIFGQEVIRKALTAFVPLKIDSDVHIESYEKLKALYPSYIAGFPTYLIIDSKSGAVIKKWSIDIDDMSLEAIAAELQKLAQLQTK